jgi:hypothetical protein
MIRVFRWYATDWLTGGLHVLIFAVSVKAQAPEVWPYSLALMAILCFFGWLAAHRRYRAAEDLPTSKIASAAQGYVELYGRAAQVVGKDTRAPFSGRSCCWFRYLVERKDRGGKWHISETGESTSEFLLIDNTGRCLINPAGAEVLAADRQVWANDQERLSEWRIPDSCELYVIGNLSTTPYPRRTFSKNAGLKILHSYEGKLARLISSTKSTGQTYIRSMNLADSILAKFASNPSTVEANMQPTQVTKPSDGRVFLIASSPPSKIARRFLVISWIHLGGVFAFSFCSIALMH